MDIVGDVSQSLFRRSVFKLNLPFEEHFFPVGSNQAIKSISRFSYKRIFKQFHRIFPCSKKAARASGTFREWFVWRNFTHMHLQTCVREIIVSICEFNTVAAYNRSITIALMQTFSWNIPDSASNQIFILEPKIRLLLVSHLV